MDGLNTLMLFEVIQEGVNLLLLKGSIGKAGAGLCPVSRSFQCTRRPDNGNF